MQQRTYRYTNKEGPPSPPNVLFDGSRLGLEASMITSLTIGVLGGLHCALSITFNMFGRISNIGPDTLIPPFAWGRFIGSWLGSLLIFTMIVFFGTAISTMGYTMLNVVFALRWLRKRRGRDVLSNAIAGGVLSVLFAVPCTGIGWTIANIVPQIGLSSLFQWPEVLSIDAIVVLWGTLMPLIGIIGGVRSGLEIGKLAEEVQMYYYF